MALLGMDFSFVFPFCLCGIGAMCFPSGRASPLKMLSYKLALMVIYFLDYPFCSRHQYYHKHKPPLPPPLLSSQQYVGSTAILQIQVSSSHPISTLIRQEPSRMPFLRMGRRSTFSWCMLFCGKDLLPRHRTTITEAIISGVIKLVLGQQYVLWGKWPDDILMEDLKLR